VASAVLHTRTCPQTAASASAAMSISGELPGEGSDGEEEVFIDEEDIIHEITIDEEG
jgi:angio-associated migratory cell protein